MFTYIKKSLWKCEWCGSEQDFHYGRQPRWCSNVCKSRDQHFEWLRKQEKLRSGPSLRRGKKSA